MKIGAIFPQTEIDSDPAVVREYAQSLEAMGYDHLLAYEHVLGIDSRLHPEYANRYNHASPFLEPFVLFSHLAAITQKIEFVLGVLVLPMRQTALVAKQAATLDVLCRGRLRMGVGVGWNRMEHEALGQDFRTRGRRMEEQIEVLRALWTREVVSFDGRWHHIRDAGLNPLPIQRPIPLWMGGHAEAVLRRAARLADGWMPTFGRNSAEAEIRTGVGRLREYLIETGRDPGSFGLEGRVYLRKDNEAEALGLAELWAELGATHLSLNTMGADFASPAEHIAALERFLRIRADRA